MITIILVLVLVFSINTTIQEDISIGVLFSEPNSPARVPLESAIYTANLLQQTFHYSINSQLIPKTDSFQSSKILCNLTQNGDGLAGVFGPVLHVMTLPVIQSVCINLEIPHMQISWRPSAIYTEDATVINFYPDPGLLSQGLATIIRNLQWRSFVVLYENDDGLIRLQDALKIQDYNDGNAHNSVIVRQLGNGNDHRTILKDIYNSSEVRIILDCETDHIIEILKQAKEMKLLEEHNRYLLTSLDAHTVDLSILNTTANITTIRIIDMEDENFRRSVSDWRQYASREPNFDEKLYEDSAIKTEAVLMYDAVTSFIDSVQALHLTEPITPKPLDCNYQQKWDSGYRIISFMKRKTQSNTVSGPINFDTYGRRINFTLLVVQGNQDKTVAKWYPDMPQFLSFTKSDDEREQDKGKELQEKKFIVSSRLGEPYLRKVKQEDGQVLVGNARYEGYSMDLISAIAQLLGFQFEFQLTADNAYGSFNPKTGQWNGLVRDLLERKADLAICDLTITHSRREVVDFSLPFMTLGISILYKKEEAEDIDMFAFLKPFSVEVWIYTATLYLTMTVIIYFVSRMAPADWENPHPCEEHPEELENIWDIKNCLWLTLGSIMAQGCDILPKGISSRMATSMWWFFSLIMISSYTANLAAFLTTERMEVSINSADDLAKQTKIKYGTVNGGATQAFFRESNFSTFQRMWTNMESSKPSVFEKSNADGVKRVRTTRNRLYAFLMESSQIEYETETKCDLKQVGNRLDSKGYGIAMQQDFPYRSMINKAILQLQESGQLANLKKKWWKEKRDEPSCSELVTEPVKSSAELALALANVGGVFIVLGVGIAMAFIIAIFEFLWNVKNVSVEEHISYVDALKIELIFAMNIWVTKKKTKPQLSESSSSASGHSEDAKSMAHSILQGANSFLNLGEIKKKDNS